MGRPKNIIPTIQLNVMIPQDLVMQMNLELYSELEQRVPFGAQQRLLTALLRAYFSEQSLDLAPWLRTPSGVFVVKAVPEVLTALTTHLSKGN